MSKNSTLQYELREFGKCTDGKNYFILRKSKPCNFAIASSLLCLWANFIVKNSTCKRFFAGVLRRVETGHQGIYLWQKWAKSKKQLGDLIDQKWQTSSQLQCHAMKIYLQYELRHKWMHRRKKNIPRKMQAIIITFWAKYSVKSWNWLLVGRGHQHAFAVMEWVHEIVCFWSEFVCIDILLARLLWCERKKGKGNIFSAS